MDYVEKSAKTADEAVNEALRELNCNLEDVEVTVLEPGSKGILGFGGKPAKVGVKVKFDPERVAKNFLREIMITMNMSVEINCKLKEKQLYIDLKGRDLGVLIGKRGQTLDSLQYLVNLIVNKGDRPYIGITLDIENYRQRRKETLEGLAANLARKVKQTRRKVVLEPMNPFERRIIHYALQNDKFVTTYSEGVEPMRNVVIAPK